MCKGVHLTDFLFGVRLCLLKKEVVFMDFAIWFLIGAALVFFMQCGFAMVEPVSPGQKTQATSS